VHPLLPLIFKETPQLEGIYIVGQVGQSWSISETSLLHGKASATGNYDIHEQLMMRERYAYHPSVSYRWSMEMYLFLS
jgi:hypothetical protein